MFFESENRNRKYSFINWFIGPLTEQKNEDYILECKWSNVNSKKDFFENLEKLNADIVCLQETKAQEDQVMEALFGCGYDIVAYSAEKKGYSSTAILTKGMNPISIVKGLGKPEHDNEGRVITAEFNDFYVVTAYVPNSKAGLLRLPYRKEWDAEVISALQRITRKKASDTEWRHECVPSGDRYSQA